MTENLAEMKIDDLIARYSHQSESLVALTSGMSREQLLARPIEGKWSTLEVVCHLADCEQFYADRIKRTLSLPRPLLLGSDTDLYVEATFYHERELDEELAIIGTTRKQLTRILSLQPAEAWQRQAVHSEAGLITLRKLLEIAVHHVEHHGNFIRAKRTALGMT